MGSKERREREKEQRKSHILDTARALLLEKGLTATSINQIAKRSELSIGAIYFYFKDKEEIFAALQLEGLGLLSQTIQKAVKKGSSPEEKIRLTAEAYFQFSEKHKNYFDIINYFLTSPGTIFSPDLKNEIDAHGSASISMLAQAISEGTGKGIFKPVDSRKLAIVLWGLFNGIIQLKKLEKTILAEDECRSLYGEALDRFLDGLRV